MTTPPDGTTTHPSLPVPEPPEVIPPRSRVPAHVVGSLAGLVVAPLAVGALLVGASGLAGSVAGLVHGEGLFLLGALLFALWMVVAGALSSLTVAVPAVAWFVAVPLLVGTVRFYDVALATPSGFRAEVASAIDVLVLGNGWMIVAALLLGGAVAIDLARRGGRRTERAEAALAATPATPPPSRLAAHVGATAAASVLAVVAGLLISVPANPAIAAIVGAALGTAAALGGFSALAPLVAGATGAMVHLVIELELLSGGASPLAQAVDPRFDALSAGAGWTWWTLLLLSALAPWQARRVGRVLERAEIAVTP